MNTTSIQNRFFETEFSQLSPAPKILYFGFSYLSWGLHQKSQVQVSVEELSELCDLSCTTIAVARKILISQSLVKVFKTPSRTLWKSLKAKTASVK